MILQGQRGKSPLAMESINDRYCRSPCGVTPFPDPEIDQKPIVREHHALAKRRRRMPELSRAQFCIDNPRLHGSTNVCAIY
jgi:hypothetical protein